MMSFRTVSCLFSAMKLSYHKMHEYETKIMKKYAECTRIYKKALDITRRNDYDNDIKMISQRYLLQPDGI